VIKFLLHVYLGVMTLGRVYKISSLHTDKVYVGSTIQKLRKRLAGHKKDMTCMSREIIELGDYKIELLEEVELIHFADRKKLFEKEKEWIENLPSVNKQVPIRSEDEKKELFKKYLEDNKEYFLEWQRNYYQEHKEERKTYREEYYRINRESILAKDKIYRDAHRDTKSENNRNYRVENKEKIEAQRRQLYTCEVCGKCIMKASKSVHERSSFHTRFLSG